MNGANLVETIIEEPEENFDIIQESLTSIYDDAENCFDGNTDLPQNYSSCIEFIDNIDASILIDDIRDGIVSPRISENIDGLPEIITKMNEGIPFREKTKEHIFAEYCRRKSMKNIAQEPWPKDVKLYQPYEVEQILLPDNANCLAVQTFLKMCNLDYKVEPRPNAEAMSPTGKVPFIRCGAFIVSELEGIVQFVGTKGISLTADMTTENKSDMRAYMTLVNNVLGNAELYICWCDSETYADVTKPRYGSIYPWPLNHIQTWSKRSEEIKRLKVLGWYQKSIEEVYSDVETCCQALTDRLDGNEFFFGSKPTELEALIFGHLYNILTTPLPNAALANTVKNFPELINLITRIEKQYFQRETQH